MIKSEVMEIKFDKNLTKHALEKFFKEKNISPVKWAITHVYGNCAKILVSY